MGWQRVLQVEGAQAVEFPSYPKGHLRPQRVVRACAAVFIFGLAHCKQAAAVSISRA